MDKYPQVIISNRWFIVESNSKLIKVKRVSSRSVFNFTLLLLSNLAYPQWISISCNDAILNHVVCFKRFRINATNFTSNIGWVCSKDSISYVGNCYLFIWFDRFTMNSREIEKKYIRMTYARLTNETLKVFKILFDAAEKNSLKVLKYAKFWLLVSCNVEQQHLHDTSGHLTLLSKVYRVNYSYNKHLPVLIKKSYRHFTSVMI